MNKKDIQLIAEQFAAIQASSSVSTPAIAIVSSEDEGNSEEVEMIISNLRQIADQASEVQQYIQGDVEEWVQEKIATCASKINSVLNNLKYAQDDCGCDGSSEQTDGEYKEENYG